MGPSADPPDLRLRAAPRPVIRLKRGLVLLVVAVGLAGLLFILGKTFDRNAGPASVPGAHPLVRPQPRPAVLEGLPASYDRITPPARRSGPAVAADLGAASPAPMTALGREGVPATGADGEAGRAARRRRAQQAQRAAEAGVFFRLGGTGAPTGRPPAAVPAAPQHGIGPGATLRRPRSRYELLAGSILSASLVTGLKSDLPGLVIAQVTENVYDTVSGRFLLIPQGARLIGTYDSHVAFGQNRALVVFQRLILPNGQSVRLKDMPASDEAGYVGLKDRLDDHTLMLLKGVALSSLLGIATDATASSTNSVLAQALRQSIQDSANQGGQQLVQKNLDVAPTITVPPGWPLKVLVSKDLVLAPYRG